MLYFENDYCEGAHPAILQKLMETNFEKVPGYGTDPYCASAKEKICAARRCVPFCRSLPGQSSFPGYFSRSRGLRSWAMERR